MVFIHKNWSLSRTGNAKKILQSEIFKMIKVTWRSLKIKGLNTPVMDMFFVVVGESNFYVYKKWSKDQDLEHRASFFFEIPAFPGGTKTCSNFTWTFNVWSPPGSCSWWDFFPRQKKTEELLEVWWPLGIVYKMGSCPLEFEKKNINQILEKKTHLARKMWWFLEDGRGSFNQES